LGSAFGGPPFGSPLAPVPSPPGPFKRAWEKEGGSQPGPPGALVWPAPRKMVGPPPPKLVFFPAGRDPRTRLFPPPTLGWPPPVFSCAPPPREAAPPTPGLTRLAGPPPQGPCRAKGSKPPAPRGPPPPFTPHPPLGAGPPGPNSSVCKGCRRAWPGPGGSARPNLRPPPPGGGGATRQKISAGYAEMRRRDPAGPSSERVGREGPWGRPVVPPAGPPLPPCWPKEPGGTHPTFSPHPRFGSPVGPAEFGRYHRAAGGPRETWLACPTGSPDGRPPPLGPAPRPRARKSPSPRVARPGKNVWQGIEAPGRHFPPWWPSQPAQKTSGLGGPALPELASSICVSGPPRCHPLVRGP